MVLEINASNFDNEVINNIGTTVVDFYADWCGPCRKMGPILEEVESEMMSKVKFVKINTDNNLEVAKEVGICPVLFNRDNEEYAGTIVNSFAEVEKILDDNF